MAVLIPSQRWRAELRLFEFTTSVTDSGWSAVYTADGHTVQVQPGHTGWRVTTVRDRDSLLLAEDFCTTVDDAAEAAVEQVLDIDLVTALQPHLTAGRAA